MSTEQQHYLAYMLRLWQVSSDGEPVWRTSLESPHTGERKGFASLDDLFDFLRRQTGPVLDANGDEMEIQHLRSDDWQENRVGPQPQSG